MRLLKQALHGAALAAAVLLGIQAGRGWAQDAPPARLEGVEAERAAVAAGRAALQRALDHCRREALGSGPRAEAALLERAELLLAFEHHERALEALEAARRLRPESEQAPAILWRMAWLEGERCGRPARALALVEELCVRHPRSEASGDALLFAAGLSLDEPARARAYAARVPAEHPRAAEAVQLMAFLEGR